MRDIRNKIAAHGCQLLKLRHIAHQQQASIRGKARQLHQQIAARITLGSQFQRDASGVVTFQIRDELRLPQQIGDAAADVGGRLQTQTGFSMQIHPLDAAVAIEDDDAIGQGLDGAPETIQLGSGLFAFLCGTAAATGQRVKYFIPRPTRFWRPRAQRRTGPVDQALDLPQLAQKKHAHNDQRHRPGALAPGNQSANATAEHCQQHC